MKFRHLVAKIQGHCPLKWMVLSAAVLGNSVSQQESLDGLPFGAQDTYKTRTRVRKKYGTYSTLTFENCGSLRLANGAIRLLSRIQILKMKLIFI
jgi:hypothetical protein